MYRHQQRWKVEIMTIDMKLKHFEDVCIGDAKASYEQTVSEYTAAQEALFTEHKETMQKAAARQLEAEQEKIRRDINKKLSVSQIKNRRDISKKTLELRGKLFSELRDELARYMETPAYTDLLAAQIQRAKAVADGAPFYVYIDPSDQDRQRALSMKTGCDVRVSQYSFIGGTRAVIASKNILIDSSFESRLKEAEENFQFALGGTHDDSNR